VRKKKQQKLRGKTKIHHLEKRFGIIAVEKGFVSADNVMEALKVQVTEDLSKGEHRLIGRIFFEQNLLTLSQLNQVLTAMERI